MLPSEQARILVDALNAAGVKAFDDASRITPPCVLVSPPTCDHDLACGWTATWQTVVVATAGGTARQAWAQLDGLAAACLAVIDGVEQVAPAQYQVGDGNPLPSYILTHTSELDWSTP